jgi:polyribonucleotide nucleotidyltransferase
MKEYSIAVGRERLTIQTGHIARQANGAVFVRYGDTMVLTACVMAPKPGLQQFLPLTVEYRERYYAAGKIPGGFFKREGRPHEKEILTMRLADRSIRPMFPKGFNHELQIFSYAVSADKENPPDILSIIGASAALTISDAPFGGPIGAVRIGQVDGVLVVNPTNAEQAVATLNLVVAGDRDGITMVEAGANEVSEELMVEALMLAHDEIRRICDMQIQMREEVGKPKFVFEAASLPEDLTAQLKEMVSSKVKDAVRTVEKASRREKLDAAEAEAVAAIAGEDEALAILVKGKFQTVVKEIMREMVLTEGKRIDGRTLEQIRQITCQVGILPRAHGSALFTRGETQALVAVTLGTAADRQRIDSIEEEGTKSFLLHYNFPGFCTGEVKRIMGTSRRETGHGALAERGLACQIPVQDSFPYTIRIVSDILESNGSSSMASVCGGSLAMMDAGVPIPKPTAGIAMGMIKDGDRVAVLSDILGDEDHLGDMDFKVIGTADGITGIQMDIKALGMTREIFIRAMEQARAGRMHILGIMAQTLERTRGELSQYAPRILFIQVKTDRIRDIIGPGGKMIRSIQEKTGTKIDIDDSGRVSIASTDEDGAKEALRIIKGLTKEAEVGESYDGIVRKVTTFGAFVEIFPGTDGLVHISQLSEARVQNVEDVVKEGDAILVKVIGIDKDGKIRLSHKEAVREKGGDPDKGNNPEEGR